MPRGYLISFEGIDGAGKSTQVKLLHDYLVQQGIPTVMTREPGATVLGKEIRHLLMMGETRMGTMAQMLLFQADRAQHFEEFVIPHLRVGNVVITDRCFDSTAVYQGWGHGLTPDLINHIDHISLAAMKGEVPELTLYLDLEPAKVWERKRDNNPLSYDWAPSSFHERLRAAFIYRTVQNPGRIKTICATLPQEKVHEEVLKHVECLFLGGDYDLTPSGVVQE